MGGDNGKAGVLIPGKAIDPDATDIGDASTALLDRLQLLPTDAELAQAGGLAAAIVGPPQSVAVIEANATALSKWWAVALGSVGVGAWPAVSLFLKDNTADHAMLIIGIAIVITSVILAIGYIVGSDVRGRAEASVATIQARQAVAETMVQTAQRAYSAPPATNEPQLVALPTAMKVHNTKESGDAEQGWLAIALLREDDKTKYLLVKAKDKRWVDEEDVLFETPT
jgi:hypothetical protein